MSTTHATPEKGTDAAALPANWTETTTTEVARFERDDGAVLRVRTELPIRDAATFNDGHVGADDADGTPVVLFNREALPSDATEIHRGGTIDDARDAALAFLTDRCTEHDRQLVVDAAGCLHCPACTEAER